MKRTVLLVALLVISLSPIVFAASVLGNGFVRWSNPASPATNLSVDGGTLFVDSNLNRVGIGTTAPNVSLNVVGHMLTQGNATVTGNLSVGAGSIFIGSTRGLIPAKSVSLVYNTTSGALTGYLQTYSAWGNLTLRSGAESTFGSSIILAARSGQDSIQFNVRDAEKMRLDSSGRLGIGTLAPAAVLDVVGSASNNATILRSGDNSVAGNGGTQIVFSYAGGLNYAHAIKTRHNADADALNAIDFYTWDYGTDVASTVGTKRVMTIDGSGGVGIGTTTVNASLNVVGNSWFSGDVSALTFTDRTPFYEGDALTEISRIKGKNGEIDHATLPEFARIRKIVNGTVEENRDIGGMVSVLTVAVQQLNTINKEQQAKINALEARIAKLEVKAG